MTAFHFGTTGETYYAKALPLTVSPWSTGVIAMTETGTTGWFSFTNDPLVNYAIYRQLGGSPASSDTAEGVIGAATQTLAGPNAITVTVTDLDTSEPIEAATIRFYRTGATGTQATDDAGQTVFGLATATWSWIATAAGYSSKTGVLSVSSNGSLAIELDGIVAVAPVNPNNATLRVTCIGEDSQIEPGAVVLIRMIEAPDGQTGFGYDGSAASFVADSNGIAEREVARGATYEIRREGRYKQWQRYTMPTDQDVIQVQSFVQP